MSSLSLSRKGLMQGGCKVDEVTHKAHRSTSSGIRQLWSHTVQAIVYNVHRIPCIALQILGSNPEQACKPRGCGQHYMAEAAGRDLCHQGVSSWLSYRQ